jgi:anaerobic magnesium-protoporphyrin IX monomethyl ester cyclase
MRILLLNPSWIFARGKRGQVYEQRFPPLILANIAAMLREDGHQVALRDANLRPLAPERLAADAMGYDLVLVTSSTITRWICPDTDTTTFDRTCAALAARGIPTVILGAHGSALPELMLRRTRAGACIVGEPEWTARELVARWPERDLPGVAWLDDGGGFHPASPRPPGDLAALPLPAFDLLEAGAYRYEILGSDLTMLELARGCPSRCSFCGHSMHGHTVRSKTPERVERELRLAHRALGIRSAYFIDLEFTLQRQPVMELCERIGRLPFPLRWCCQTRADAVDAQLLTSMKAAGCALVHFGVESGSQPVLDRAGKGMDLETIARGVRLAREAGLDTACFFMFGLPGETPADMRRTLRFALRLDPTYASFHTAVPFPGTPFHAAFDPPPPDPFPTHFSQEHRWESLERRRRQATARYFLRPSYLLRRLRRAELHELPAQLRVFLWYLR